ncbi:WD repeat-containing protein 27 [Talpa occidentalis]|uniref:WD repeat-containing protein 27 n=1 Tax=Talpa occidentalis TaxID=50954 RepID=UPI0023F90F11|nr:WD repeat-containing protein 27 [Talpa occidentalis]
MEGAPPAACEDRVRQRWAASPGVPAPHVQLACGPRLCAFPLAGNQLCVRSTGGPACQPLILSGHHQPVTALAFGNVATPPLLCSASRDRVLTWDLDGCREQARQGLAPQGTVQGSLVGHVRFLSCSPDDRALAVCTGARVLVLDLRGQSAPLELEGHLGPVTAAEFCPWQAGVVISVSEDRTFKVWDLGAGALLYSSPVLTAHPLLSALADAGSEQLVVGSTEGQLWVFSLAEGRRYRRVARVDLPTERTRFLARSALARPGPAGPATPPPRLPGATPESSPLALEWTLPGDSETLWPGPPHPEALAGAQRSLTRAVPEFSCPSWSASCAWVGSATAVFLLNLANFELEAVLPYTGEGLRAAPSLPAGGPLCVCGGALCLLSGLLGPDVRLLEVRLAAAGAHPRAGAPGPLCVLASSAVPATSPLYSGTARGRRPQPAGRKPPAVWRGVQDQPLVFHSQVRSSGYAAAPPAALFTPRTNPRSGGAGPPRPRGSRPRSTARLDVSFPVLSGSLQGGRLPIEAHGVQPEGRGGQRLPRAACTAIGSRERARLPLAASAFTLSGLPRSPDWPPDSGLPTRLRQQRPAASSRAAVCCVQYSGDGQRLACGLASHLALVFRADLTGTPAACSGHDGAVSGLSWSHDGRWLLSTSRDRTLRLWSARRTELALVLGEGLFPAPPGAAQFYYMDAFILLSSGPELQLLQHRVEPGKGELRRHKQRSRCRRVFRLPLSAEITSLAAVNDFYSHVVLTAGRNRTLEVVDLAAGRSAAVIAEAHSRPVHQICQNRGSAFTSQQAQAYNLFATAAVGDAVRLWDLRTLRCERRFEAPPSRGRPCGLAFSPCGRYVACGAEDGHAYVYEVGCSTFAHRLAGHTDTVMDVAFSPSAPQLVTATLDGMLQLFTTE